MSDVAGNHRLLKRRSLSPKALLFTVFCCVSGGPFGLEPLIKEAGGGLAILLILLTPIFWALPDALTTAELAPAIPVEGGYIVWVQRAMGPFWGFLNAWWTWIYTLVDAAIYPVLFTTYLSTLLHSAWKIDVFEENPLAKWLMALLVVAVFTAINIRGTKLVGRTSTVFAIAIIAPFALMSVIGLVRLGISPRPIVTAFLPADTSLGAGLAGGLGVVMWNYLGWDALSTVAEEVEKPERAYPIALLVGLPLVTLVYLLPTIVGLAFFPNIEGWQEGAWPAIAYAVGGPWLGYAVNLVGLLSPLALFTASLLGSSRVPFVLAEERYLPKALVRIHPRFGTPWIAILVCASVYSVLIYQTFQELVALNVVMYGVALVLEALSLVILRIKEPDLPRPFRIRGGWPVLVTMALLPLLCVVLLVSLDIREEGWAKQQLTGYALLSGPILYGVIRARRKGEDARKFTPVD